MTDENNTSPGNDQGVHAAQPTSSYQATYAQGGSATQIPSGYTPASGIPNPAAQAVHYASPAGVAQAQKGSGGKTFLIAFAGALLACVLALGVASALGVMGGGSSSGGTSTTLGATTSTTIDAEDDDATLAEAVAEKCLPSVVSIDVYANETSSYGFGYGYGQNSSSNELTQSSLGSGVVLSSDGYIITNYHVVEDGVAYKVTIEGETYDAELVGSDPSSDIAVLKAQNASGLTAIEIGDSDNLTVGEWVMSIGNPFGLEQSVATGIVSATSRSQIMDSSTDAYGNSTGEVTVYPNMIQTDAAINPGNSGGALVDSDGKLIGINTLITSYSGNYSGVGFAIPVNYALGIAQQIIDGETPTHAQLGVSLSTISSSIADRYGFSVDAGAYVSAVTSGSGAEEAGVQVGDIITAFDGQTVESASDVILDVRSKNPGDTVTLTVNRDGQSVDLTVTLGSDGQEESTQQSSSSLLDMLRGGSSSGQNDA